MPDTPFNRAWFIAGKLFTDEVKRISFYKRVEVLMPFIDDRKYRKYVDRGIANLRDDGKAP